MHASLQAKGLVGLAYYELGFRQITNNLRPINTVADVFEDPQVIHRRMRLDLDNPRAAGGSTPGLRAGLVIDGAPDAPPPSDDALRDALRDQLARGASVKDAANAVAIAFGASRRAVYELALTVPRTQR